MKIKKLKDFLTLGSSNLAASTIIGIFWLYLASLLPKTEYGELGFLMSIVNVGFAIAILGLRNTILVYLPKKENILLPSLALSSISSTIVAIIVFIITQNIFVTILIVGLNFYNLTLHGLLGNKRYKDYAKYRLFRASLAVIFALIFFEIYGLSGILFGFFISTLFILWEIPKLIKNKKIELSVYRSKIRFMLHSFANRLSHVIWAWGDKIVIGTMFSFTMLASFHFAAQYILLLDSIPKSMAQYLIPQEAEGKKNKKMKKYFILIACMITVISIFAVPTVINTLLPKYEDSILPIQIMSFTLIPSSINRIQQAQFLGKENSQIVFIGGVCQAGLYLVLVIVLGQSFGLIGLASGFLSAVIFRAIFNLFASKFYLVKNKSI